MRAAGEDGDHGPQPHPWRLGVTRVAAALVVLAAATGGALAGAATMAAVQDAGSAPTPGTPEGGSGPPDGGPTATDPTVAAVPDPAVPEPATTETASPDPAVLLAWTPDGLDPGLVAAAPGAPEGTAGPGAPRLDREPGPLPADTGVLHTAVRHGVAAESGNLVDDDATHLQTVDGAERGVQRACPHTRVQPVPGVVRHGEGGVEVRHRDADMVDGGDGECDWRAG